MLQICKNIRLRRETMGLSQEELAKKMGYKSRSSINKIEMGENGIPQSKIEAFARALETTPASLMGWEDFAEPSIFDIKNIIPITTTKIPLLGEISCGELKYAEEDFNGYVECGAEVGADFALRCKGDSMIGARILDGDIVFIRKQSTLENGDIAAVMEEDEATLKRYRRVGNMVILSPENSAYDDIVVNLDEESSFRIIGKAVAFQSNVR